MIVTTTETIPGYRRTRTLGQVFGVVVRSRGWAAISSPDCARSSAARSTNIPNFSKKPAARP